MAKNYEWASPNPKLYVIDPPLKNKNCKIDEQYPRSQLVAILKVLALDQSAANNGKIKKLYGLALITFSIVGLVFSLKGRIMYVYIHLPKVIAFADILSLANIFIMCVFNMVYSTFCNQQMCGNSYDNFRTVDNLLGIKPEIHIFLRKFITHFLVVVITILILIFSFDFYTWTTSYDYIHSVSYSINYFYFFVNTLSTIDFVIYLYYLWGKFYIMNTQLKAYFKLVDNGKKSEREAHYFIKPNKNSVFANLILKSNFLEKLGEEAVEEKPFSADGFMKTYMILCDQADSYNYNFSFQVSYHYLIHYKF